MTTKQMIGLLKTLPPDMGVYMQESLDDGAATLMDEVKPMLTRLKQWPEVQLDGMYTIDRGDGGGWTHVRAVSIDYDRNTIIIMPDDMITYNDN